MTGWRIRGGPAGWGRRRGKGSTMAALPIPAIVPAHLHEGLERYLTHHVRPGSFLTAVLENDLRTAVLRGDDLALAGLVPLVRYLYDRVPLVAWGSPEHVAAWLATSSHADEGIRS